MRALLMKRLVWAKVLALGVCGTLPLAAQLIAPRPGEPLPSFEVATIRTSPEGGHMSRIQWGEDTYRVDNVTLRMVIRGAYGATSEAQIVGGPDALLATHFDIHAKAPRAWRRQSANCRGTARDARAI